MQQYADAGASLDGWGEVFGNYKTGDMGTK